MKTIEDCTNINSKFDFNEKIYVFKKDFQDYIINVGKLKIENTVVYIKNEQELEIIVRWYRHRCNLPFHNEGWVKCKDLFVSNKCFNLFEGSLNTLECYLYNENVIYNFKEIIIKLN